MIEYVVKQKGRNDSTLRPSFVTIY